ncbi:MAG: LTA synthase family protein [Tannerella sp.]|nr:LTA synthase family protein [Tannerella sp.]
MFFSLFLFKILWFDFSWCVISTFRPFSCVELYLFGALFALTLSAPSVFFRKPFLLWMTDAALGCLLVANLIYFRTYYTAIPLSSYGLVGNMRDFTSSIYASLRPEDILFPVSTLVAVFFRLKRRRAQGSRRPEAAGAAGKAPVDTPCQTPGRWLCRGRYLLLVAIVVVAAGAWLSVRGGFKKSYEALQSSYTHTCGTPLYTVIGSVYYDYIRDREIYTPETGRHIAGWLERHAASGGQAALSVERRMNCILILAESLESWVLERTVEGQEIMPCMNRLLRDSTTLYASEVLSQVKGGRSIDAQLMMNTGLLPVDIGVYSLKYPHNLYPSLARAMREKHGEAYACTLTADKPFVWNQSMTVPAFGYDSLLSKDHFVQDEQVGPHYRHQLGDVSLLRQCAEKMRGGEVWKPGANLLQIVTYSGHFPFALPEDLKKVHFSGDIPFRMRDYMTVARYTDQALGLFVERVRALPAFDSTLIVIAGDHEGLADMRDDLCRDKAGRGVVSETPCVPLIVLNVPPALRSALRQQKEAFDCSGACMRYKKVMGQIDIYPTLLDLLGLTDYAWRGLGRSILRSGQKGIAVNAYDAVYGDAENISGEDMRHLKEAWKVSDEIIRYDYFRQQ